DIDQAVVVAHQDDSGHKRLLAYVVLHKNKILSTQQLHEHLEQRLPQYMIPAMFILLDGLPMTPTGKVNRGDLPPPFMQVRPEVDHSFESARTPLEETLTTIWQNVLNIEQIGIHDDFFSLGGDSFLLITLFSTIKNQLGTDVPLADLLQELNIADLANLLQHKAPHPSHTALSVNELQGYAICPLQSQLPAVTELNKPKNILLTGATGFLGSFLLQELLEKTDADIYCLVRGKDPSQALQRLLDSQKQRELSLSTDFHKRLHVVCGDMAKPLLGVTRKQWKHLTELIDSVYHAAANINMLYPYPVLHAINVQGTQEIIKFSTHSRCKTLHYISSTAIFEAQGFFHRQQPIPENIDIQECARIYGGYAQSKWVAEKLLHQAREKGLAVSIYRLGMLTGHSRSGVSNINDMMCKLLKQFVVQKRIPELTTPLDMTPVDYVAQVIVHLSQQTPENGYCFHVVNPQPPSFFELYRFFNQLGYPLQMINYAQWIDQLENLSLDSKENALGTMLPIFTESVEGKTYLEFSSLCQNFNHDNTHLGLSNSSIRCSAVTPDLLSTYLNYFVRQGFLSAP
ncbi:MAG: thioester reductase domain-containing protein, partial [SAR324 cluster bacterium]|nr:thioester reductase domain-containing protein [SAR324 cluster bacterium]